MPDGEAEADADGEACPVAAPFAEGVDCAPVLVRGALVAALGAEVVVFGAEVVVLGADVVAGLLVVATGALVAGGAGGATLGCCPEPNRKPTTVPEPGS